MKNPLKIFLILIISPFLSIPNTLSADSVLAKIDDKVITLSEFERIINSYPESKKRSIRENPSLKAPILNRMVQTTVISDIAREEGFDKNPVIKKRLEFLINDLLSTEYLKYKTTGDITVTDEDVRQYYLAHKEIFIRPEKVKARHILIAISDKTDNRQKEEAASKAKDIISRLRENENFENLAKQFSDDCGTRNKGGDLGFLARGKTVKSFEEAAFSLNPGEISDIVQTKFGFHIIKVEGKAPEELIPIEKVKDKIIEKIKKDIAEVRRRDLIESALKNSKIEVNGEKLFKQP